LYLFSSLFYAQDASQIDSLKNNLRHGVHDTIVANSYFELALYFKKKDPDSCVYYLTELNAYATKNHSSLGHYYYYGLRAGYYQLFKGEKEDTYKFIIENLEKNLKYAKKTNNPSYICKSYDRLAQEYSRGGNASKGLESAKKSLAIAKENKLWKEQAYVNSILGEIYHQDMKKEEQALQYLLQSDSIYQANNYKGIDRGFTSVSIGDIYKSLEKYDESMSYYNKAKELFKESEYQTMYVLGRIASLENKMKNHQKAIDLMLNCIAFYKKNNYPLKEAGFCQGISEMYFDANQKYNAFKYANLSLKIRKENKSNYGIMLSYISLAKLRLKNNEPAKSYLLAKNGFQKANELASITEQKEALEILQRSAAKLKKYKEAYNYLVDYNVFKDSISKNESLAKTKELEAKYSNQKKEREIALLKSEKKITELKNKSSRKLLLAGLGILSLVALSFFFLYKNRKKASKKLRELDKAKSSFFTNISHEFRTPLTLISGTIQKELTHKDLTESKRASFEMIQRNSKSLLSLVNQLLDISKVESATLKLSVSQSDLLTFTGVLSDSFTDLAKQKNINYQVYYKPTAIKTWYDKQVIEKILVNLLANAFKYTPIKGKVISSAEIVGKSFHFEIKNTGKPLTTNEIKRIFNRFYQIDDKASGTGIGLSLVKELVKLHKGTVQVKNLDDKWIVFTLQIPINLEAYKHKEVQENTEYIESIPSLNNKKNTSEQTEQLIENSTDKPLLLIVDDHADIRKFLGDLFKESYQILKARNGQEGIDIALEQIPDLIISDIMMPVKNGIELCNTLKVDERTSHIPIIILTAKKGEEHTIKGIQTGADDYMTKPFNNELLQLKVKKLLENVKKLQKRYSQELILKPTDIAISSVDELFLEKLQTVIDTSLVESSFSTNDFCHAVNMSRMQLHRKIKALFGITTTQFIRNQRLKLAKDLLQNSDVNISQIAYEVGFNDPTYFSKCFKEVYDCTPTEYVKKHKDV